MAENGPEWARNSRNHSKISIPSPKKHLGSVEVVFGLITFQLLSHNFWLIPLIHSSTQCLILEWLHSLFSAHFGPFLPIFAIFWLIIESVEVVYDLTTFQVLIIHYFWVIPHIQCRFIWRNADFSAIFTIFGSFWPIFTHFRLLFD